MSVLSVVKTLAATVPRVDTTHRGKSFAALGVLNTEEEQKAKRLARHGGRGECTHLQGGGYQKPSKNVGSAKISQKCRKRKFRVFKKKATGTNKHAKLNNTSFQATAGKFRLLFKFYIV